MICEKYYKSLRLVKNMLMVYVILYILLDQASLMVHVFDYTLMLEIITYKKYWHIKIPQGSVHRLDKVLEIIKCEN